MQRFTKTALSIGVVIDTPIETSDRPERVPLVNTKKKDGWYYLTIVCGVPVGVIGNWKTGEKIEVKSGGGFDGIPRAELQAIRLQRELAKTETKRLRENASREATEYIQSLQPCPEDHPYLVEKGINPSGALFDEEDGSLVVPLSYNGTITSWQKIWAKSQGRGTSKLFLKHGLKKGCSFTIAGIIPEIVCEGFATGASIHEATGRRVLVAFDAGNLKPVCDQLNYPVVAADNDHKKEKNVGMKKAQETGHKVVFPKGIDGTDFNDMHQELGIGAVSSCFSDPLVTVMSAEEAHETGSMSIKLDDLIPDKGLIKIGCDGLMQPGMPKILQYSLPVVLTSLARAISGKIICNGVWPNIFCLKVGGTSTGKTVSDKEMASAMRNVGINDLVGLTDIASGQALYRSFEESQNLLFSMDEATSLFRRSGKTDPVSDAKRDALMDIYSKSGERIVKCFGQSKNNICVDSPCLSFVGNATPLIFDELSNVDFTSGIIPRLEFFTFDDKIPYRGTRRPENIILERFCNGIRTMLTAISTGSVMDIGLSKEATEILSTLSVSITDKLNSCKDSDHHGVYSRMYDMAIKYAMIHHASMTFDGGLFGKIEATDIEWGTSMARRTMEWKVGILSGKIASGDFHRSQNVFMEAVIAAAKSKQRPTYRVLANRRKVLNDWEPMFSQKVISVLHKSGKIIIDETKNKTAYYAPSSSVC